MEVEQASGSSEDSWRSLSAVDILIRSSSFHMKKKPVDSLAVASADCQPATCMKKRICISANKVREVTPPSRPERSLLTGDGRVQIPPALLANRPATQKPSTVADEDGNEGAENRAFCRHSEHLPSPEKETQPSQLTSKARYGEKSAQVLPQVNEDARKQNVADMFISQYDTEQKEAVRAVFKQRIQHLPVFKEVKVQLLDDGRPERTDDARATQGDVDSAATIAAATAAAIASTAPFLRVQSELEAKVSSVSEILKKLQETDRQLQRLAKQQANLKAQTPERPSCHRRIEELEKQISLFMEQRIQHLESLQQQQMTIQTHLISSALTSGGFQAGRASSSITTTKHAARELFANQGSIHQWDFPSNSIPAQTYSQPFENHGIHRQKSPLKTPAPRRFAPVPVSKDTKISPKISKRENSVGEKENIHQSSYGGILGGGRLLEQILNDQEIPFPQNEPTNNAVIPGPLGRECRSNGLKPAPFPAFRSTLQSLNPIERTAKKADDVLHDLGQLKREMRDILKDAKEWKADVNNSKKAPSHYRGNHHLLSRPPAHSLRPSSEVLLRDPSPSEHKDPLAPSLSELQRLSKSSILQSAKASKCILRDAEEILRAVRKNKRLLEENLEAIIRAQDGNALHAFVNELTADRDVLEEIRIRRTVDEWIKAISMEIQDEMAKKDFFRTQPPIKTVKSRQEVSDKSSYPRGMPTKRLLPAGRTFPKLMDKRPLRTRPGVSNEDHLSQVYGRPMFQAHRSTLKKSPYLRFNSPPPKPRPPRPKLVESVRGTKVKSAKTQTGASTYSQVLSAKKPGPQELRYLFSPTKDAPDASGPFEGHLIPMAIPLGKKQINSISPQPAGITIGEFHPITVTSSVPSKPQLKVKKPNVAIIEMKSEKKVPPKLSMEVLPNVDIDSTSSEGASVNPGSLTPLPAKVMLQATPESSLLLEEDPKLPGADFVDVAGVSQDEQEDDIPEFSEPVLEFNRHGETMSPTYNGPPFPPAAPAPYPSADILEEIIEKRETLENKLVSWVEQEVMARIISGMYPAQREAVCNISTSESEESQAGSSDIVEAAGAEGFQLFVSAGTPVDSEMIRRFVNEALAETVAVMLGDREGQRTAPSVVVPSAVTLMPEKETTICTPVATPEATPPQSPTPVKEMSPAKTPEPSPPVSEVDGDVGRQQFAAAAAAAAESKTTVASPVSTPVATPRASPPRVATPSPPVSVRTPKAGMVEGQMPPSAWDDAELPLEEEKPSPQYEGGETRPSALILSVGVDEEPDSLVLPAPSQPAKLSDLPRAPSPSIHTPSSGPTTEESSQTSTETETVDRPISEGEVLYSCGQLVAAKAVAEGGVSFPSLSDSLTSTLHDVQEMVYDPPSEGQVVQRPLRGIHRDPFLCLFSKLNQVPLASQEEICQSESTSGSAGELSEGQRPKLTKAAESVLLGCPLQVDRPTGQMVKKAPLQTAPPGPSGQATGGEVHITYGPMSLAELEQPKTQTAHRDGGLASHADDALQKKFQMVLQTGPVKARHICVKSKSEVTSQQGFHRDTDQSLIEPKPLLSEGEATSHPSPAPGPAKMSVTVPSASVEDLSISSIRGSSESSGADTF